MMKRYFILLLVMFLLCQSIVMAAPSEWATAFVDAAMTAAMVPEPLQMDYQQQIKRYEYVLLALAVLDKYDVSYTVSDQHPFTDAIGHPYEVAIAQGYAAGIISGYDDGTFRPDNPISRQEITALVYNLVKRINPEVSLPATTSQFYDDGAIKPWARDYVNFCYQEGIMSGTGMKNKRAVISPLGQATREQAIVLLWKLYVNRQLLDKVIPSVYTESGEQSSSLNTLAANLNQSTGNLLYEIQKKDMTTVGMLSDEYCLINYPDGALILNNVSNLLELNVVVKTPTRQGVKDFESLYAALFDKDIHKTLAGYLQALEVDHLDEFKGNIDENKYLHVFYDEERDVYAVHLDVVGR